MTIEELMKDKYQEGKSEGLEIGKAEGLEIGKAEGLEIGKVEANKETAIKMKKDGEPVEKIARYTKLTIEEIENL